MLHIGRYSPAPRPGRERHDGGGPVRRILILLEHLVEVDDEVVPGPLNGETVHPACGAPFDEDPVRLVLRVVLGALEAVIRLIPPQCRVLMRAGQVEGLRLPLPAHEDHLVLFVDLRAVGGRDRVVHRLVIAPASGDHRQVGGKGGRRPGADRHKRRRGGKKGLPKELAPPLAQGAVPAIAEVLSSVGHW